MVRIGEAAEFDEQGDGWFINIRIPHIATLPTLQIPKPSSPLLFVGVAGSGNIGVRAIFNCFHISSMQRRSLDAQNPQKRLLCIAGVDSIPDNAAARRTALSRDIIGRCGKFPHTIEGVDELILETVQPEGLDAPSQISL